MNSLAERKIITPLLILLGMASLFYRCGTTKTSQQSPRKPDTVTVTVENRRIFSVSIYDAVPNEDGGSWNSVDSAAVMLLGTDQVQILDAKTLVVHFYDVPEVFTLRATHPDYESGEVTVDMKKLKRNAPNRHHYGAAIFLEKKKGK